jgi:hypothetical protein
MCLFKGRYEYLQSMQGIWNQSNILTYAYLVWDQR